MSFLINNIYHRDVSIYQSTIKTGPEYHIDVSSTQLFGAFLGSLAYLCRAFSHILCSGLKLSGV